MSADLESESLKGGCAGVELHADPQGEGAAIAPHPTNAHLRKRASVGWARREREAAKTLGTKRVRRSRYQAAPDLEAVVLASGEVLTVEVKTRKRLPRLLADALAQAQRYAPHATPLAVVSERGGRALAVVDLVTLARWLGLGAPLLARGATRKRFRDAKQLTLLPDTKQPPEGAQRPRTMMTLPDPQEAALAARRLAALEADRRRWLAAERARLAGVLVTDDPPPVGLTRAELAHEVCQ